MTKTKSISDVERLWTFDFGSPPTHGALRFDPKGGWPFNWRQRRRLARRTDLTGLWTWVQARMDDEDWIVNSHPMDYSDVQHPPTMWRHMWMNAGFTLSPKDARHLVSANDEKLLVLLSAKQGGQILVQPWGRMKRLNQAAAPWLGWLGLLVGLVGIAVAVAMAT